MFAKKTCTPFLAAATLASAIGVTPVYADVLTDVQFGATGPQPSTAFAGAALIGAAGDEWNYFQSASGTGVALATSTGAASGLSLDFTADGAYGLAAGTSAFTSTPYAALMQAFLYQDGGTAVTATFSGLAPGQQFNLYLYTQSDAVSGSAYGGVFTVNGDSQTALNDATSSTFIDGVNYLEFSGTADALGEVALTSVTAPDRQQVILNGLQLDVLPEPASLVLVTVGMAGLLVARRSGR